MRKIACFHGQFAIDADDIDGVVDGAHVHKAYGSGSRLDNLEDISVGVGDHDGIFVSGNQGLPFADIHFIQALERFDFALGILVQDQDHRGAIRPLSDFGAKNPSKVSGGDGANIVFLVDHDRHVMGETRSEEGQEKNKEYGKALRFHEHIHLEMSFGGP